jgi:hypothetical protein
MSTMILLKHYAALRDGFTVGGAYKSLSGSRERVIRKFRGGCYARASGNEVMDGYLAGICARTGNLHVALDSSHIDQHLLDEAAGIIRACP